MQVNAKSRRKWIERGEELMLERLREIRPLFDNPGMLCTHRRKTRADADTMICIVRLATDLAEPSLL